MTKMTKLLLVAACCAMAAWTLLTPSRARAHYLVRHHVHHHHVRRAPPPPPPPARAEAHTPSEADMFLLGIGVRVSGIAFEGHKLHLSDIENPVMGGVGIQFRSKFTRHWGLELAADYLRGGDESNFVQWTVPVSLSGMFFLFPDSRLNPYALAGIGVHFTSLEYQGGDFTYDTIEVAGILGAGLQVRLSRSFALHADIRFMFVYKNLSEEVSIRDSCMSSMGSQRGFCNGLSAFDPDDKFNLGLQFQAGVTYFF